jgi:hypothetical protein
MRRGESDQAHIDKLNAEAEAAGLSPEARALVDLRTVAKEKLHLEWDTEGFECIVWWDNTPLVMIRSADFGVEAYFAEEATDFNQHYPDRLPPRGRYELHSWDNDDPDEGEWTGNRGGPLWESALGAQWLNDNDDEE